MRRINFKHHFDSGISVEPYFIFQFIYPPTVDAWVAIFQFSGKLKGIVDFIIAFAIWIFANKTADMIRHFQPLNSNYKILQGS